MTRRLSPNLRRAAILQAAVQLAVTEGFKAVTRDAVAEAASVSAGLVSYHFHHTDLLRQAVMEEAVRLELHAVIAAGLVNGSEVAHAAPVALKQAAVDSLLLAGGGV